jgi:leukotriene-A4 hydrolase
MNSQSEAAVGSNPDMLYARYTSGGHFSPHTDGYTVVDLNTRSLYSVLVYLNHCEVGGATRMLILSPGQAYAMDDGGRFRAPEGSVVGEALVRPGSVLVFDQTLLHEGEPVGAGQEKYIIRTDVMFTRTPPICTGEKDVRAWHMMKEAERLEEAGDSLAAADLFRRCFKLSPALAAVYGI